MGYPPERGRLSTRYSPVRHFTRPANRAFSCDLHVLGMPPALILSQDQTLQFYLEFSRTRTHYLVFKEQDFGDYYCNNFPAAVKGFVFRFSLAAPPSGNCFCNPTRLPCQPLSADFFPPRRAQPCRLPGNGDLYPITPALSSTLLEKSGQSASFQLWGLWVAQAFQPGSFRRVRLTHHFVHFSFPSCTWERRFPRCTWEAALSAQAALGLLSAKLRRPPLPQLSQAAGLGPGWLPAFRFQTSNQWPGNPRPPASMLNQ